MRCRLALALLALGSFSACAVTVPHESRYERANVRHHPRGMASFRFGDGDAELDDSVTTLEPESSFGGARFEFVPKTFGGGFQFDVYDTNRIGPVDSSSVEFFGHFTARTMAGDRFRVPFRIGPTLKLHSLDGVGGDTDFVAFGGQLQIEPEFDIVRQRGFALSIFGQATGAISRGFIDADVPNDTFVTTATTLGAAGGFRFQFGGFLLTLGYQGIYETEYDESDPEGGMVIPETLFGYDGPFISFGGRW